MIAIDYIRHWEGFVQRLYLCPAGYPTIGYGTRVATWKVGPHGAGALTIDHDALADAHIRSLIAADTGDWITRDQATALMLPEVERAEDSALLQFRTAPGEARLIALTDLIYNLGSLKAFPRFVAAVKAGNWQRAHDELLYTSAPVPDRAGGPMRTHYYRQTGRRAECNARIILTGEMPEVLP